MKYNVIPSEKAREHLLELANLLEKAEFNSESGFNMGNFLTSYNEETCREVFLDPEDVLETYHECGTVCCAAGFGAIEGIGKEYYKRVKGKGKAYGSGWWNYIGIVFIGLKSKSSDMFIDVQYHPIYAWCFSQYWEKIDNTPKGAARRIKLMLDNPEKVSNLLESAMDSKGTRSNLNDAEAYDDTAIMYFDSDHYPFEREVC